MIFLGVLLGFFWLVPYLLLNYRRNQREYHFQFLPKDLKLLIIKEIILYEFSLCEFDPFRQNPTEFCKLHKILWNDPELRNLRNFYYRNRFMEISVRYGLGLCLSKIVEDQYIVVDSDWRNPLRIVKTRYKHGKEPLIICKRFVLSFGVDKGYRFVGQVDDGKYMFKKILPCSPPPNHSAAILHDTCI
jgi:hypothetical protein